MLKPQGAGAILVPAWAQQRILSESAGWWRGQHLKVQRYCWGKVLGERNVSLG